MVLAAAVGERGGIGVFGERSLPAPHHTAFSVPVPAPLAHGPSVSQWAPVRQASVVRALPGPTSTVVDQLPALTPEATTNLVQILDRESNDDGLWIKVSVPGIPQSATGWVNREALGSPRTVFTELTVNRATRTATLTWQGKVVFTAPVAVGAAVSPTPAGTFYVRNRLSKYSSAFYGPLAFGTSARSAVLTDWPAGGFVGIHGTNRPDLIPGAVSHGCVRMKNPDIVRLGRLMPVGTPVTIT